MRGNSREGGRERDININNPLFTEREREVEKRLNREMNIKQTETEGGGSTAQRCIQSSDGGMKMKRGRRWTSDGGQV